MTKSKRIEIYSVDGCAPCDVAIRSAELVAKKHNIDLKISKDKNAELYPKTCVVREKDGEEVEECFLGWNEDYKEELTQIIDDE